MLIRCARLSRYHSRRTYVIVQRCSIPEIPRYRDGAQAIAIKRSMYVTKISWEASRKVELQVWQSNLNVSRVNSLLVPRPDESSTVGGEYLATGQWGVHGITDGEYELRLEFVGRPPSYELRSQSIPQRDVELHTHRRLHVFEYIGLDYCPRGRRLWALPHNAVASHHSRQSRVSRVAKPSTSFPSDLHGDLYGASVSAHM